MKKVVVIGGGAAGMMAAAAAAERDCRVVLLEKNDKLGRKLFITGKGRCNLTNACDMDGLFGNVVTNPKFLYSAFYRFDNHMVMEWFRNAGCPVKTERGGRVFPVSDHSSDVIGGLARQLKQLKVKVLLGAEAESLVFASVRKEEDISNTVTEGNSVATGIRIIRDGAATGMGIIGNSAAADMGIIGDGAAEGVGIMECGIAADKEMAGSGKAVTDLDGVSASRAVTGVKLADGTVETADAVIVATGGLAYPLTGSTGDGYRMAAEAGHTVKETYPSLVPFIIKESWCGQLQGLALKNVSVSLYGDKKKTFYEGFGEMLFTHFGVSGPLILSASSYYSGRKKKGDVKLNLDLKPALTEEQLDKRLLRDFEENRKKQFKNSLGGLFPAKLIPVMVMLSGIDGEKKIHEVSKEERRRFAHAIKNVEMTVAGTRDYAEAVITKGGIHVKEVNPSTMESKKVRGLYFAGEVLDVDALTGGFNLQIAWSTGYAAGASAADGQPDTGRLRG